MCPALQVILAEDVLLHGKLVALKIMKRHCSQLGLQVSFIQPACQTFVQLCSAPCNLQQTAFSFFPK